MSLPKRVSGLRRCQCHLNKSPPDNPDAGKRLKRSTVEGKAVARLRYMVKGRLKRESVFKVPVHAISVYRIHVRRKIMIM